MSSGQELFDYSYVLEFENSFQHLKTRMWMTEHWTNGFYYCGIYITLIFGGRYYMTNRSKLELRDFLSFWNTSLAIFSVTGFIRTVHELAYVLRTQNLYYSVCISSFIEQDKVAGFWTWIFVLSKLFELGDTIFIVLRKQSLIFLHWYHHITVLLYSWFSYTEYSATARWFIVMNYSVHSIMYSYYALKAMRYSPSKWISMTITILQLSQMIVGCIVNMIAFYYKQQKIYCHTSNMNIKLSLSMYLSYFILFTQFFYVNYFSNNKKVKY